MIQEERAERFYRTRTLKRFLLGLLDHVTQERLLEWDRQELLCFRLSFHLPALQTGAAAMLPGLGEASVSAAQGEREGRAAGEAGAESGRGSARFPLLSAVIRRRSPCFHTDDTQTSQ